MPKFPGKFRTAVLSAAFVAALAACGDPTKEDIIEDSRGIETKTALMDKLGQPDDISKVGPIERWTYNASNGSVIFVITGEKVALQATGGN
jgi:hypothetical protein